MEFDKNLFTQMKVTYLFVAATILICASCNNTKEKDYSLTLQEYLDMGVPDPYMTWNVDQNREANSIIGSIKWEKPYQLPRKDSEKSGMLFDRFVTLDNMTFLSNDTLKLHEKAYYSLEFFQLIEYWKETYTNPIWKTQYYQRELAEIHINQVRVTQIMVDIAEKIMLSEDPVDKMMREGVPSVKQNYISSMINALHAQKETAEVLNDVVLRMTDSLSTSIERNIDWLDVSSRKEIKNSVVAISDSTSLKYVRSRYEEIIKLLQ